MWVPSHFASADPAWPLEIVDACPFGLLVTGGGAVESAEEPSATHVPMLVHPDDRDRAARGLEGVRILGHLARANPQWRDAPAQALLVFEGPNGYVTPVVYPDEPAAPTWNYIAVHLAGPIRFLHDRREMLEVIDLTIEETERAIAGDWDPAPSREYHERIVGGIVAFELLVERAAATFKLSQDQPPARRRAVIDACERDGRADLAAWVRRANPDPEAPAAGTPTAKARAGTQPDAASADGRGAPGGPERRDDAHPGGRCPVG